MRAILRWDESLRVGVEVIDNQHKILFDLANDLHNAVNTGAGRQVVDTLFSVIVNYSFKHFTTEEELVDDLGNYQDHCCQHYKLIKQLHQYVLDFRNNRTDGIGPGEFLETWLLGHIREYDIPALEPKVETIAFQEVDSFDEFSDQEKERRLHKRIRSSKIVDGDIVGHLYNANNMKTGTATVMDLSVGGLRISTKQRLDVDDLLIISCMVGKNFKMREKLRVVSRHEEFYGVEFVAPSEETRRFLTELCGAIHKYH
ncbi:MAG: bacteriohemerythrin [Desulfopila sp.]|jgi:hemerythrin-like metal-binding protein|nr:bacteriohemerythrin [Desulfopila sp.]